MLRAGGEMTPASSVAWVGICTPGPAEIGTVTQVQMPRNTERFAQSEGGLFSVGQLGPQGSHILPLPLYMA